MKAFLQRLSSGSTSAKPYITRAARGHPPCCQLQTWNFIYLYGTSLTKGSSKCLATKKNNMNNRGKENNRKLKQTHKPTRRLPLRRHGLGLSSEVRKRLPLGPTHTKRKVMVHVCRVDRHRAVGQHPTQVDQRQLLAWW